MTNYSLFGLWRTAELSEEPAAVRVYVAFSELLPNNTVSQYERTPSEVTTQGVELRHTDTEYKCWPRTGDRNCTFTLVLLPVLGLCFVSCEINGCCVFFGFVFLVCWLFLARRDSVLLEWAPFNQTRDGPGQNKHASPTRTIANRTAAKLIFFLFSHRTDVKMFTFNWLHGTLVTGTTDRNSLLYGYYKIITTLQNRSLTVSHTHTHTHTKAILLCVCVWLTVK
jgi:hypothetical protein